MTISPLWLEIAEMPITVIKWWIDSTLLIYFLRLYIVDADDDQLEYRTPKSREILVFVCLLKGPKDA